MAKADFREVLKGALPDAKEHLGSPSDVAKTIQSLRTEISVLREALLRTYATSQLPHPIEGGACKSSS